MATYFTSDTHYGHKNIIKYANRPFQSVEEMNETFIRNWNACVAPTDTVYHLGDFAFCDPAEATKIVKRLNGNKFLIFGNHDKKLRRDKQFVSAWGWCRDLATVTVDEQVITLCHYAMRVWDRSHHGSWHLYGHSHGTLPDDPHSLSIDVGVDCWRFKPVSMAEVRMCMRNKTFAPVDRHGAD